MDATARSASSRPAAPTRWGVLLPTFDPAGRGTPPLLAAARRAEQLGFDALWAADHLLSPAPVLDSLCSLAAAAAVTERIELGLGVLQLALRGPAWLAKQLTTIDALAPGRLRLGVGVGGEFLAEFTATGVARETRGRHVDELLGLLPGLLRGEPVDHPGPLAPLRLPGLRPAISAVPPLSIGGRSDAALRRAARFGEQWLGMWFDPADVGKAALRLAELAGRHDRPAPSIGLLVLACVDDDRDAARRAAATVIAGQYRMPFRVVERWTPYGCAEHVAAAFRDYRAAGVGEFVMMSGSPDPLEQYERFALVRDLVEAVPA